MLAVTQLASDAKTSTVGSSQFVLCSRCFNQTSADILQREITQVEMGVT